MAFTYSHSLTSDRDKVRWLLQDTVEATARLQDEEIAFALSTEANIYMAAALCCDTLAIRYRGVKSKSVGGLSISYGGEEWAGRAKMLRQRGASAYGVPTAGGVYVSDRDTAREDTSLIQPEFFSGMMQDPENTAAPTGRNEEEE